MTNPISTAIIERSTKSLQKLSADVIKAATELGALSDQSTALALQIEDQNMKLAALDAAYDTARRTADAQLKLAILEDSKVQLQALLKTFGLANISEQEVKDLQAKLYASEQGTADAIAQAKQANRAELEAAFRNASAQAASTHALESATLKADATAKDAEIAFLKNQVAYLQKQVEDERNTRLEIAKADASKQGVVVNAGK